MESSTSLQKNVDVFKNYLLNICGDEKPLCKLFSTDKNNYLYDTGTNKIVKCEYPEFESRRRLGCPIDQKARELIYNY